MIEAPAVMLGLFVMDFLLEAPREGVSQVALKLTDKQPSD
jgi:hypothetical protein